MTQPRMLNALTVDVEEYFHARRLSSCLRRQDWDALPAQLPYALHALLEILESHHIKATFFVLGWIAKKYPQLIQALAKEGHEVASHGCYHQNITQLSPQVFYQDVKNSKQWLEDCIGLSVKGYRAPNFSLNKATLWAWDMLEKAGYSYSSSVYPIYHDHYGWPEGPRFITRMPATSMIEIPISTLRFGKIPFPCGGGGYFRLLPYAYSAQAIELLNKKEKLPAIFYFHPWELVSTLPNSLKISWINRSLSTLNQKKMHKKLNDLLKQFQWGPIFDVLKQSLYYPYSNSCVG